MKKFLSILLVMTVTMISCSNISSAVDYKLTDNEILTMYTKAVLKSKKEKPAYKYSLDMENTYSEIKINDPLNLLALAGSSKDNMEKELKNDIVSENNHNVVYCEKNSRQSEEFLPTECCLMDASLLKSISMCETDNNNYVIIIDFMDEKNPKSDSVVNCALGIETIEMLEKNLNSELYDEYIGEVKSKLNSVLYSNISLICEINPETLELNFLSYSYDLLTDISIDTLVAINILYSVRNTNSFYNFSYSDCDYDYKTNEPSSLLYCSGSSKRPFDYNIDGIYDGHINGEWKIIRPVTSEHTGIRNFYCADCGAVTKTEIIPKLEAKVNFVSLNDIALTYKDSVILSPIIDADKNTEYTVFYESTDNSVVKVDKNGKIYGAGIGKAGIICTVTDKYGNSVSDTCTVTVKFTFFRLFIKILLSFFA